MQLYKENALDYTYLGANSESSYSKFDALKKEGCLKRLSVVL